MRHMLTALIVLVLAGGAAWGQPTEHEVKRGETLYGIARRYNISVQQLSEANRLESPDLLLPGTLLTVARHHEVRRGETLYGIARRYQTTVEDLKRLNTIEGTTIRAGQRLLVPLTGPARAVPGSAETSPRAAADQPSTTEGDSSGAVASRDSRKDDDQTGDSPDSSRESPERPSLIPLARQMEAPLSYSQGGTWPVVGEHTLLKGKLPGVLIRADRGSPVSAVAAGRVVYSGPHSTFGNVVFIQSPQGYIYVYGGQERVQVEVGQAVSAGATLGTVGTSPAESGGAALYFSVWRGESFVDPETAPRG
ncbi:lipoprotein NlpD [Alkalispirochaeta americana]|uniref:Lipoprotein NlpD n=1 Tax=Alkalispirochaeta americana TaxID=159291 RepID=A0A1N6UID3_9SPIO|nr:LysM peptidoglycan-binding domain-containing M23 family metallopeptidase [Alkalispirochaeta americana]SIQ65312.1 lipoprotein NlpD [Alkalispirochaeta americana]